MPQHLEVVLEVVRQVHTTLTATHAAGLVHGDTQPFNIVVVPTGSEPEGGSFTAVLVDWGVSVSLGEAMDAGVLAYRLGNLGTACAADDLTALGITFIALWCGAPYCTPWEGAFTLEAMRAERAEWVSSADGWGAMPEDVKERFPEDVVTAIQRLALAAV